MTEPRILKQIAAAFGKVATKNFFPYIILRTKTDHQISMLTNLVSIPQYFKDKSHMETIKNHKEY